MKNFEGNNSVNIKCILISCNLNSYLAIDILHIFNSLNNMILSNSNKLNYRKLSNYHMYLSKKYRYRFINNTKIYIKNNLMHLYNYHNFQHMLNTR